MAGQGSARVTLREIDLSQVRNPQELPQGVPAAVVGPARKGPAFVPQTFANMQQFNEKFGSMIENNRESNSNLFAPLALNEWMRNSKAGTYLRVLGVGNGLKSDSYGKVGEAGFVVGQELVQESSSDVGKVNKNKWANITDNDISREKATTNARTYMLGCFMQDAVGSDFLADAGVQITPSGARISNPIVVDNTAQAGDTIQILVPHEVLSATDDESFTNPANTDVTLVIKLVNALANDITTLNDNEIEILFDNNQHTIATRIRAALGHLLLQAKTDDFQYNKLSFKPGKVFGSSIGAAGTATITELILRTNISEGSNVTISQTVGAGNKATLMNVNEAANALNPYTRSFSDASKAAPIIRGMLMAPQGVVITMEPNSNLGDYTHASVATDTQIRSEVNAKTFGNDEDANLIGYMIGDVDLTDQSFKLILNGFSNTNKPAVITCSFDPDSTTYISKVLNTDPTKIEEFGHYLYLHLDVDKNVAVPSNDGLERDGAQLAGNYANMIGFLLTGAKGHADSDPSQPDYESFDTRFKTASSPWIVSQFYSGSDSALRPDTASAGSAYKLFKLHALDDGEIGNSQFRVLVSNLRYVSSTEFGSFDLTLEAFDSDPIAGEALASWKNLTLDPNSRNFIGRVIGDKHTYFDFDRDLNKQRLVEEGLYEVRNNFVRVELSSDLVSENVPVDALPSGFQSLTHLHTATDPTHAVKNFVEDAGGALAAGNHVFKNTDNSKQSILNEAVTLPVDYVKSINRMVASEEEADSILPWGVKLSVRENGDAENKELVEQVFNKAVYSLTKYLPALDANPASLSGDDADGFQKSMFSLEKVHIPSASLDSDVISTWNGAKYVKGGGDNPLDLDSGSRFVNISKDAKGGNSKYLKFRCIMQGGFDGVNIFDKEKASLSGVASLREGADETGTQKFTGPTVSSYQRAIDVLSDKSATEFQVLAIPGQRTAEVTNYAIDACEDRFDALFVMDIEPVDGSTILIEDDLRKPSVRQTIKNFENRALNTSFAAAYFPDVLMRRPSDRAPIVVPPSVGMMGVMSRNDAIADPWFAPAGLNRGRLSAIDSNLQMNRDLLDELYDADINPIYVPAGRPGEVYAFGQKTLLQDQSALDRINVRRLLINIRRRVRKIAESLLFEPNRESTLVRFNNLVEPIMADVQQRRGVTRYKVQIDTTTTTQNDIENNTIRGKIYLQPTKSVEFISLDFVVTNTIQD